MGDYQLTKTWKKIYGDGFLNKKESEFLKIEYEKFRMNVKLLAGEIGAKLPDYTIHDITHIDALWEMVDIFLPKDYHLTPVECFVLGGAFLLHDLGMGISAYPGGVEEIRNETLWRDTVANLCKNRNLKYDFSNIETIDDDVKKEATETTLRMLHSLKAKKLANIHWEDNTGKRFYLIDDARLRDAYGSIIGLIAQSHCLPIENLYKVFPVILGPLSCFPQSWSVDPLKLACILRVADAMHIDDRRAPTLLKTIRKISGFSQYHWIFQEKLYKPRLDNNRLVYTSKSPFTLQEVESWWLCYDTLVMIDREIKNVDNLLLEQGRDNFNLNGICGINDLEKLRSMISVEGWEPVDTKIRINNVAKLVSTLGGYQLYGDNNFVPLRELIQNSCDAIRARRVIDNEDESFGDIIISWGEEEGEEFIEIEDNGVGMSSKVIVNVLLDFGQSFWKSSLMHQEFPGLEQKSFESTGKFGIGFFSVFMWGDKVRVISNRYDMGRDSTMVLDFLGGVSSRPILRKAKDEEVIKNGGTKVKVWLNKIKLNKIFHCQEDFSDEEIISRLCFAIDSNLYLKKENKKLLIRANDWITISEKRFFV